jgi:subtilisin-like proprotein convertase family protein/N-acetylneuraminic acid mutarotase
MKKNRFWIMIFVLLLSLTLTGAVLAAAGSQEGGPGTDETSAATEGKVEGAETAPAGPFTPVPDGILSVSYVYTNSTPVAIPDSTCAAGNYVTSTINIPDSFLIGDLNVGLWIAHTYRGDLEVRLRAPDGTTLVQLIQDPDAGADNVNALIDDSSPNAPDAVNHTAPPPYYYAWWRATGNLSNFTGLNAQGTWTIEACDDAGGDIGTITNWTLFFESGLVLTPSDQNDQACKGSDVVYDYTIINATAVTQSFNIAYNSTWPAYGPATTPVLAAGESWDFQVTHHIPWSANTGDQDVLGVNASGGGDAASATATTTAALVQGWQDYANSPAGRGARAPSVVYWNGKLYKIGGYGGAGAAQPWLDIYDIVSNTWSQGADMPAGRYWLDCVAIDLTGSDPKIYCAGGYLTSAQSTLYIYDINSNTWTTGAPLPAARYSYAGVALNGLYYVIGGWTTTYQATMVVYNPATNTWDSTRAPMATTRRYHSAGAIGGKIYVAGGYNVAYLSSAEVYDPALNTWSAIAPMPSAWLNAADGVKHDRYLVLAGGAAASTAAASNGALIYDAVTNTWEWLPVMSHLLYGAEGDSDGSNFWVASGRLYEGGIYSYSTYTSRMVQCETTCTPVSGADFTWNPLQPWANWPATFNATVATGSPLSPSSETWRWR